MSSKDIREAGVISYDMRESNSANQTDHTKARIDDLKDLIISEEGKFAVSINPTKQKYSVQIFLYDVFLVLFVIMYGVQPTMLIFELDFLASSLIEHYVTWEPVIISDDDEQGMIMEDSLRAIIVFENSYIIVKGYQKIPQDGDSFFTVFYRKNDGPNRYGDSRNGAFPTAGSEERHIDLEDLELFCTPKNCRNQNDLWYNFAHLKIFHDHTDQYFFFVCSRFDFFKDEQSRYHESESNEFKSSHFEFSLPIGCICVVPPKSIEFNFNDDTRCSENFFDAMFIIGIGSIEYRCQIIFDSFENCAIMHYKTFYSLSIIRKPDDNTTIFCSDSDAYDMISRGAVRVGKFSIEIPEFVAPKTELPSELTLALKVLPRELQFFLEQITWQNPESTVVQAAAAVESI